MTQTILFSTLAVLLLVTLWDANNGTWSGSRPTVVHRYWLTQLDV
jgi:hypothetical protein